MFFPPELVERARAHPELVRHCRDSAAPWLAMDDDELWSLVFGNTISRSWMVLSDGHCPACLKDVNMYRWEIEPLQRPWKVRCPRCGELFPKNDFAAFYRSGLDDSGVFAPERADRELLVHEESMPTGDWPPDFGVDDGEGYTDGERCWRFIGTYLVYGQWKGLVVAGIQRLAAAYVSSGDPLCARKAGILLDRVADLYPSFDFGRQGVLYERSGDRGYVSTWHDACEEVQTLCLAYDQVREALRRDTELSAFLSRQADGFDLPAPKSSPQQVCENIEVRIFRDTLDHIDKIQSNFPTTDMAVIVIRAVLEGVDGIAEVEALFDDALRRGTRVDGVSGEKGLAGYGAIAPRVFARYLSLFSRALPDFLPGVLDRVPEIRDLFRFHIDTWCMQQYYPSAGDAGGFARPSPAYAGATFDPEGGLSLAPSMYSFFWQLYEATSDAAFVQVLHHANGGTVDGLPRDPMATDAARFQQQVQRVIDREGPVPEVGSVDKKAWHLAILRTGSGETARAVWLDYDSGEPSGLYADRIDPKVRGRGAHSHADGLNLGLYYRGLDLMPDFGYPPVNYGGWNSAHAEWYKMTAAHNTVAVDGLEHAIAGGDTVLWADGDQIRALRVSAPDLNDGGRFERTVVMIDVGRADSYVLDLFRVAGGRDHTRFMHSHFSELQTSGLDLEPAEDYGRDTLMRNFLVDASPQSGWWADWRVDDRYGLGPDADVHLRYTDLTRQARAFTCEGWVTAGYYGDNEEVWIPRIMQRRSAAVEPLRSTFVGVIEPYSGTPYIASVSRLESEPAAGDIEHIAVQVMLADGGRDIVVAADVQPLSGDARQPLSHTVSVAGLQLELNAELALLRYDPAGELRRLALARSTGLICGDLVLELEGATDFVEIDTAGGSTVVSGRAEVARLERGGHNLLR